MNQNQVQNKYKEEDNIWSFHYIEKFKQGKGFLSYLYEVNIKGTTIKCDPHKFILCLTESYN